MIRPAVYMVGASGTGKSTLASWVATVYGIPLVQASASAVAEGFGGFAAIDRDGLRDDFQTAVFKDRHAKIAQQYRDGRPFVTDRSCLDAVAYAACEAGNAWTFARSADFAQTATAMRGLANVDFRNVVFFLRPDPEVLAAARETDAGRRSQYLTDEWVYRIDGILQYLLEAHEIPYIPVTGPARRDRRKLVGAVVDLATKK